MRRYLVVANQTLLGDSLLGTIRQCLAAGPCQFYLVVPATHVSDHMVWTEGHDRAVAERRLHEALERFRWLGADVGGEVGDANAIEAVGDLLRRDPAFDHVILSTLPPGASRWLGQDLPHRLERAFHLPTTVLVSAVVAA
jgi:GABA permease